MTDKEKDLLERLEEAFQTIQLGLFARLCFRYTDTHVDDKAGLLAAAVGNAIFGSKAQSKRGETFAHENQKLIKKQMQKIGYIRISQRVNMTKALSGFN